MVQKMSAEALGGLIFKNMGSAKQSYDKLPELVSFNQILLDALWETGLKSLVNS